MVPASTQSEWKSHPERVQSDVARKAISMGVQDEPGVNQRGLSALLSRITPNIEITSSSLKLAAGPQAR